MQSYQSADFRKERKKENNAKNSHSEIKLQKAISLK